MPVDPSELQPIAEHIYPDAVSVTHLGSGGFASTFRVELTDDVMAVKILDPDRVARPERVEREAIALQTVDHPNVVSYRDFGSTEFNQTEYCYIVMGYVKGRPLDQHLEENGEMEQAAALRLVEEIVQGAEAIWECDITHRDLAPKNIVITEDGSPVIVDLGIARHHELTTITGQQVPGTPGWMAPEQLRDDPDRGDWRSDQFVIGLILYRLLLQELPYTSQNILELWEAPLNQELRDPGTVDPSLPLAGTRLLNHMTAREPFERYLRPFELLEDIRRATDAVEQPDARTPSEDAVLFGWAQGNLKNYADRQFALNLRASGLFIDAQNHGDARTTEFVDYGRESGSIVVIDPVNYYDRGPIASRNIGYRDLPYGEHEQLDEPPTDDTRYDYCKTIVDHQARYGVTTLIGPYFVADERELEWVRASLECGRTAREIVTEQEGEEARPIWEAAAVQSNFVRDAGPRARLLNVLTERAPDVLYLLVEANQPSYGPLSDAGVLRGMRRVIEVMDRAETKVIFGRRYSCGLLLSALGAYGWTTGVSATHQNLKSHDEEVVEGQQGGPADDWYYVPSLLNSIRLSTRAQLANEHAGVVRPTNAYSTQLFNEDDTLTEIDTEQRYLLNRHNLMAMRRQTSQLAIADQEDRPEIIRQWVNEAQRHYEGLPPILDDREDGSFLPGWRATL